MEPKLSVIVPTRGPKAALQKTLNGLFQAADAGNVEYIIINDGANQAIQAYLESLKGEGWCISVIENDRNKGSYAARNQGIRQARGEWLLFADDDLTIPQEWWKLAAPFLQTHDFICCNIQVDKLTRESLAQRYSRVHGFSAKAKWTHQNFGLTGFLWVRATIFQEVGLFDEELYAGGDLIFSLKVAEAGYKRTFIEDLIPRHRPKNWRDQFFTLCRNHKGKLDQAKHYPSHFQKVKTLRELLRTAKALSLVLWNYQHTLLYQSGEVNWWQHQVAQLNYFTLYSLALILVHSFPKKPFNW